MGGETFGQWIAAVRKSADLTQRELAHRLGDLLTFEDVNELEHDRLDPRNPSLLKRLGDALGLEHAELQDRSARHPDDRRRRGEVRRSTSDALLAFRRERRDV
jgi:transcriptional regulator with XRE-family HTH domain